MASRTLRAFSDAESGEVSSADVVVVGERIADVGPGLDGDEAVDCSGLTLLPGLIDCHAHMAFTGLAEADRQTSPSLRLLRAVPMLRATLRLGVTTVRDAWGPMPGSGTRSAPGSTPTHPGTPWLPRGVFDGPDQVRGAVRRMLRSGATLVVAEAGSVLDGEFAEVRRNCSVTWRTLRPTAPHRFHTVARRPWHTVARSASREQ